MTALNTTVSQGQASHDFRRGLLVGAAAAALLAASMVAAAFGAGLIGTGQQAAAPAAPAVEAYPDLGLRAPAVQAPAAPAVEPYTDFGLRNPPAAPAVEPYTDFGLRNPPPARIDQSNPHHNGPIQAW